MFPKLGLATGLERRSIRFRPNLLLLGRTRITSVHLLSKISEDPVGVSENCGCVRNLAPHSGKPLKPSTVRYGTASTGSLVHCPFARLPNSRSGCKNFFRSRCFPLAAQRPALFPRQNQSIRPSPHKASFHATVFVEISLQISQHIDS